MKNLSVKKLALAGLALSVIAAAMPPCPPFVAHATSPSGRRESFKGRGLGKKVRLYKSNPLCYTTLIQSRICGKL